MSRPAAQTFHAPPRVVTLASEVADKARELLGDDIDVIWFGSWIRGNAQPHSDIDLAIDAERPIPPQKVALLRDWIDEMPTLFTIDLVNLQEASPRLQQEIRSHGISIGWHTPPVRR